MPWWYSTSMGGSRETASTIALFPQGALTASALWVHSGRADFHPAGTSGGAHSSPRHAGEPSGSGVLIALRAMS
jgi:hypothetical protein